MVVEPAPSSERRVGEVSSSKVTKSWIIEPSEVCFVSRNATTECSPFAPSGAAAMRAGRDFDTMVLVSLVPKVVRVIAPPLPWQ